ncbi:unnamed protein product [Trifolium pratense]|uniref:Uncharacterized protein n=1 Tax=Trifolium pratense TaxID=57577 RepID=A0ACB0KF92_TRIPR|nr:unnamed protein product [Trifolium pratense]
MYPTNLVVLSSQKLKECTNNFNLSNLIGLTQFGRLFRGNFQGQRVLVKILDDEKLKHISSKYNDEHFIIKEEMKFWTNPNLKGCPNLTTFIGYTCERDIKGIVYDINPLDTLDNVIKKDGMNWVQRIDVIHEVAKLLKFIHEQEKQNMVLNISASHILLDKDLKPKLFDLLLVSEVKMQKEQSTKSTSYIDPYFSLRAGGHEWDRSCEVYSFGILMLELITKRISNIGNKEQSLNMDSLIHIWAKKEFKPNCSLVHKHLQEDWLYCSEDGVAITLLALHCIEYFPTNRPSMRGVLQNLENLTVLQHLSDVRSTKREKKF